MKKDVFVKLIESHLNFDKLKDLDEIKIVVGTNIDKQKEFKIKKDKNRETIILLENEPIAKINTDFMLVIVLNEEKIKNLRRKDLIDLINILNNI